MVRGRRRLFAVAAAVLVLAGCASPAPSAREDASAGDDMPMPDFSGPYAAEYRNAWQSSGTVFVHTVLMDEQITDQEWVEVAERMARCFDDNGADFGGYEPDGAYSVTPRDAGVSDDALNQIADDCEVESGHRWIGVLRGAERMNPENQEVAEIIAACLVRSEVVPPGYTAERYLQDSTNDSIPYVDPETGPAALLACNADPLGLGLE